MTDVAYSRELLQDFNNLLLDFRYFMTLNLIHQDKNLIPEQAKKMQELIQYSTNCATKLTDLFKEPILSYEKYNREKLEKNMSNLLKFFYDYIQYADPILRICKPDLYNGRFSKVTDNYRNFRKKYF